MPRRGFEPPCPCGRYHLKVVRLPISPPGLIGLTTRGGKRMRVPSFKATPPRLNTRIARAQRIGAESAAAEIPAPVHSVPSANDAFKSTPQIASLPRRSYPLSPTSWRTTPDPHHPDEHGDRPSTPPAEGSGSGRVFPRLRAGCSQGRAPGLPRQGRRGTRVLPPLFGLRKALCQPRHGRPLAQ